MAASKALAAGAYLLFYERQVPRSIVPKPAAAAGEDAAAAGPTPAAEPAAVAAAGRQQAAAAEGAAEAAAGQEEQVQEAQAQAQRPEQHEQQHEPMLRVVTAPGSLPHMRSPCSAAASTDSAGAADHAGSAASAVASDHEQLLVEGEVEGIERVLPDGRLHASASVGDIDTSRHATALAMVHQAQQELQQQQRQVQGVAAEPPQQQLGAQQDAEQRGGDADSTCSDAPSELEPSSNPYNLLELAGLCCSVASRSGTDASGSDNEELSSRSSGSRSGGGDGPVGFVEVRGPLVPQETASEGSQATQQVQQLLPIMVAEQHPLTGVHDTPAAAGAAHADHSAAAPAPSSPAALQAAHASSSATTPARHVPAHEAAIETPLDRGKRVLRVAVALPGTEGKAAVDWKVQARRSGTALHQTLVLRAAQYELDLPLPVPVEGEAGKAAWAAADEQLTLTWPAL